MNKRNLISSVMTILMPMFLFGQVVTEEKVETSIGGVVSDESNNPIVGANVIVEGTDLGSAADADGYYSIDLGAGSHTLTASAIGYESQSSEVSIKEGDAELLTLYWQYQQLRCQHWKFWLPVQAKKHLLLILQ